MTTAGPPPSDGTPDPLDVAGATRRDRARVVDRRFRLCGEAADLRGAARPAAPPDPDRRGRHHRHPDRADRRAVPRIPRADARAPARRRGRVPRDGRDAGLDQVADALAARSERDRGRGRATRAPSSWRACSSTSASRRSRARSASASCSGATCSPRARTGSRPRPEAEREIEVGLFELVDAMRRALARGGHTGAAHEVEIETITVRERIMAVMEVLASREACEFEDLLVGRCSVVDARADRRDVPRDPRAHAARGDRPVPGPRRARRAARPDPRAPSRRRGRSRLGAARLRADVIRRAVNATERAHPPSSAEGYRVEREQERRIVEAIILAASEPIAPARIAAVLPSCNPSQVRAIVDELNAEYAEQRRAFEIWEVAGGYQLRSLPEFAPYLRQIQTTRPLRLSPAVARDARGDRLPPARRRARRSSTSAASTRARCCAACSTASSCGSPATARCPAARSSTPRRAASSRCSGSRSSAICPRCARSRRSRRRRGERGRERESRATSRRRRDAERVRADHALTQGGRSLAIPHCSSSAARVHARADRAPSRGARERIPASKSLGVSALSN